MIGRAKAKVLPLPVLAAMTMLSLLMMRGMTFLWTGVGSTNPFADRPWIISGSSPSFSNSCICKFSSAANLCSVTSCSIPRRFACARDVGCSKRLYKASLCPISSLLSEIGNAFTVKLVNFRRIAIDVDRNGRENENETRINEDMMRANTIHEIKATLNEDIVCVFIASVDIYLDI